MPRSAARRSIPISPCTTPPNDICHCWGGAAETLEDSLADYSLAQWADTLGDTRTYRQMAPRAGYWKNTYNPAVGYQAARKADGSWQTGFTPSTDVGFAQGIERDLHLDGPAGRVRAGRR